MRVVVFIILSTSPPHPGSHLASSHVAVDKSSYLPSCIFNPALAALGILIIHINM